MATVLENLKTARDNIGEKIAELSANPKPTYSVNGVSFSHAEYLKGLQDSLDSLTTQILRYEPYCYVSQVL